jgi:hypothetical protein
MASGRAITSEGYVSTPVRTLCFTGLTLQQSRHRLSGFEVHGNVASCDHGKRQDWRFLGYDLYLYELKNGLNLRSWTEFAVELCDHQANFLWPENFE